MDGKLLDVLNVPLGGQVKVSLPIFSSHPSLENFTYFIKLFSGLFEIFWAL